MKDNKRKELMSGLVLDFSSDSDQLMKEHVIPALEELQEMFFANDKKALDLYREAGLDEIKVQWRNFDTVRLNFFQRRRIKKIADDQELLGDAQIHFIFFWECHYQTQTGSDEEIWQV